MCWGVGRSGKVRGGLGKCVGVWGSLPRSVGEVCKGVGKCVGVWGGSVGVVCTEQDNWTQANLMRAT